MIHATTPYIGGLASETQEEQRKGLACLSARKGQPIQIKKPSLSVSPCLKLEPFEVQKSMINSVCIFVLMHFLVPVRLEAPVPEYCKEGCCPGNLWAVSKQEVPESSQQSLIFLLFLCFPEFAVDSKDFTVLQRGT